MGNVLEITTGCFLCFASIVSTVSAAYVPNIENAIGVQGWQDGTRGFNPISAHAKNHAYLMWYYSGYGYRNGYRHAVLNKRIEVKWTSQTPEIQKVLYRGWYQTAKDEAYCYIKGFNEPEAHHAYCWHNYNLPWIRGRNEGWRSRSTGFKRWFANDVEHKVSHSQKIIGKL